MLFIRMHSNLRFFQKRVIVPFRLYESSYNDSVHQENDETAPVRCPIVFGSLDGDINRQLAADVSYAAI